MDQVKEKISMMKKKGKQLAVNSQAINIIKLDPDTISQRLIESVAMVRELLQSNRELRETINNLTTEKETSENEGCVLQGENVEL